MPNWCFFAPDPAEHDYRLLYRVIGLRGVYSGWRSESEIAERRWYHTVWCPGRRSDKALFDMCAEFLHEVGHRPERATRTAVYAALRGRVWTRVRRYENSRTQAFQFAVVRCSGYAGGDTEFLYLSPLCVLTTAEA